MFYSQFILAKKGPLGTIWIAAHLERKLRKNQVADTDIGVSVDSILFPEVPIALRLSSHLLLGVVRIYSRKVNYLFDDCSDALLKIKQAFRSAAVDLPPEQSKAPYHSITLPETFDLDDFELPDNEIFQGNFVDHHVSAREQITLQDTMDGVAFPTSQFGPDERFGDGDASQIGLDLDEELFMDKGEAAGTSNILMDTDADPQTSTKASSPLKGDENNEGTSDPPVASSANYFSIQAPSTPGLMEEPNLPGAQEAFVNDDHMDDDHNMTESAAKEVSDMNEQETGKGRSPKVELSTEAKELISSGNAQLDDSNEHVKAAAALDNVVNGGCIDNESNLAADNQPKGPCGVGINGNAEQLTEATVNMNVHSSNLCAGSGKTSLNGTRPILSDDQSCFDAKSPNASRCNADESLSGPSAPVLQACNSQIHHASNGISSPVGASDFPNKDDVDNSLTTSEKEGANSVPGVSAEVEDNINMDGKAHNRIERENNLENEPSSEISNLPAPEMLRSMPNLLVEQSENFLVECTPGREDLAGGDGDATMEKMISGRKRSYTESTLTIQSLNSAESSGATQSKRSVEYVPEDDDLLSSILVGRKSTPLKLKPTPSVTHPGPSKRQRAAVRSSVNKRKVLVDDATVLHGDTIRQQLTDTEDIRRVRKKAPCTGQEIWMLQKQILEDDIFSETVFTGMSPDLASLCYGTVNLSRIRVIQEEKSKKTNEMEPSTRPLAGEEAGGVETQPSVATSDQENGEKLIENSDQQELTVAADGENLHKTQAVENEEAKEASEDGRIEKGTADGNMMDDTTNDPLSLNKTNDMAIPGNNDAPCQLFDERGGVQPTKEDESTLEKPDSKETSDGKHLSEDMEVETTVVREDTQDHHDTSVAHSLPFENGAMEENQLNEDGVATTDDVLAFEDRQHDENSEDLKLDSSCAAEADFSCQNTMVTSGEKLEYSEADPKIFMESTPICTDSVDAGSHAEFGTDAIEHDTDFLNVDDDDVAEDYEGDVPSTEEKRIVDNSGWSSRTRAVANYLQVLFDKESEHGKKEVSLEGLLYGKSRKEASRMFFETLVLKTKDYIHAEQGNSFCDIRIKPRGKLLKSEY